MKQHTFLPSYQRWCSSISENSRVSQWHKWTLGSNRIIHNKHIPWPHWNQFDQHKWAEKLHKSSHFGAAIWWIYSRAKATWVDNHSYFAGIVLLLVFGIDMWWLLRAFDPVDMQRFVLLFIWTIYATYETKFIIFLNFQASIWMKM